MKLGGLEMGVTIDAHPSYTRIKARSKPPAAGPYLEYKPTAAVPTIDVAYGVNVTVPMNATFIPQTLNSPDGHRSVLVQTRAEFDRLALQGWTPQFQRLVPRA